MKYVTVETTRRTRIRRVVMLMVKVRDRERKVKSHVGMVIVTKVTRLMMKLGMSVHIISRPGQLLGRGEQMLLDVTRSYSMLSG